MILKLLISIHLLFNFVYCITFYEIHSNGLSLKEQANLKNQSSTSTNNNCTNELCENCGINSERCIFDPVKCTIKCECKTGFEGIFCESSLTNMQSTTTPKYRFADDFFYLKELAWTDILNSLNDVEFKTGNLDFIERVIHKLRRIFEILYFEGKLEVSDVLKYKSVLEFICRQSDRKFVLNENLIENLFYVMDNIIYLNDLISNKSNKNSLSIFEQLNNNHAKSGLLLLKYFEELSKYFEFTSYSTQKVLKFKNFESLIQISIPPNHMKAQFHAKNTQIINKNIVDSIELNEIVLRKLFQNQTIKLSFHIFFNQKQSKLNQNDQEQSFYEQINSKLKAKNFIYEITNGIITYESKKSMAENLYFISSNVISAKIHNHFDLKLRDSISNEELEKFVRIQFLVNLNDFSNSNNDEFELKNQLRCVFWNDTSMKWSSNGCRKSLKESHYILDNDNHDNRYFLKVCYCNHLTNFALLFDPYNQNNLDDFYDDEDGELASLLNYTYSIVNQYILKYLTLIGILLSSICYFLLIVYRLEFLNRKLVQYKDMSSSQMTSSSSTKISTFFSSSSLSSSSYNYSNSNKYKDETLRRLYLSNSFCLLVSNVLFLLNFLIKPSSKRIIRKLNASLLHYFLLVSFCFSLGIAWQHFNKLVRVFSQHNPLSNKSKLMLFIFNQSNFYVKCFLLSVFIPSLFALYGYQYLFMFDQGFYWFTPPYLYYLFVAPLITLLLISLIFYIIVSIKVISIYKENNNSNISVITINGYSSYNQKRVIVLLTFSLITLGLTWLIGIFIVITSNLNTNRYFKLFVDFLFCLFNSFHGLCLLIGNLLAIKYGKQAANIFNNNVKKSILKNKTNNKNNNHQDENNIRLSLIARIFIHYYRFVGKFKRNNDTNKKEETNKKEPYIEFDIYHNDMNKQNETKRVQIKTDNSSDVPQVGRSLGSMSRSCENILNQINMDIKKYIESNKIKKSNQRNTEEIDIRI